MPSFWTYGHRRLEAGGRRTLVEQNIDRIVRSAGGGQVRVSIPVEVADRYRTYLAGSDGGGDIGLEGTVAVALKDAGRAAAVRGYSQIEEAILVEITYDDIPGVIANRVIRWRLKRAIAIAQENQQRYSGKHLWLPDPECRRG